MRHRRDHAPNLRAVLANHRLPDLVQSKGPQGLTLVLLGTNRATPLRNQQLAHDDQAPCPARARSMPAGATSSIGSPRRAATSSGRCSIFKAATVACTTLMALSLPSDFDSTSWIPAHSR